jgi:malate dehydrogenase (oxaloacetate-decarboxylating)(NADP+)
MNACEITGRKLSDIKIVINGAGAAGIACLELMKLGGVSSQNIILCDTKGTIYKGRTEGMNSFKEKYAIETSARSLAEALKGADVFIGLSAKGAVNQSMIKNMAAKPIIFAMANPDPEITPEEVLAIIPDAIVATGRSDYPNQVNNVMGFPYIFRGALDVRATKVNEEMKLAAARAIAKLAKEGVPNQVKLAYPGRNLVYGNEYIIPTPFDPRLIVEVSVAVAKSAIETGVARKRIDNWDEYKHQLIGHINPSMNIISMAFRKLQKSPIKKKVVFAEGEEPEVVRAAIYLHENGYCKPILVGREDKIHSVLKSLGTLENSDIEIINAGKLESKLEEFTLNLYKNLQRKGYLLRDCEKLIKTDRNVFAASLLHFGMADAMLTGYTRGFRKSFSDIRHVISPKKDEIAYGFSILSGSDRTILIGDTAINENPTAEELAIIGMKLAEKAKLLNLAPGVAFVSYSNFGSREGEHIDVIRSAIKILDNKKTDFEYDGEMSIDIALSENPRKIYPFNKLSKTANILIPNNLTASNISVNLMKSMAKGVSVIGPIIAGFEKPVQIVKYGADFEDIVNSISFMLSEGD